MDASVEQLKRGRRRGGREEEEGGRFTDSEGAWSVCIGGERERKGERACAWCVCVRNGERERESKIVVCVRVCVWKKEAEPVNGELAGFLPLETSAMLLCLWTLSSTATTTRPKGIGAVSRGDSLAL